MSDTRDLTGTVVVVTGAGSGIGACVVDGLLAAGALVVAGELRAGLVTERWAGREDVVEVVGDVGDPDTAARLVAAGQAGWGRVDSVVANAGVGFFGGVGDVSEAEVVAMTRANWLGTVWLARAAVAHFRSHGQEGDVVVVGSVAGLGGGGGDEAVYAGTKAAQLQFARSLSREVRPHGIRVCAVAPAAVNTHFAVATGRFHGAPPEEADFLRPEDVAAAVVTMLQQPRRVRTALWTMWSSVEADG